MGKECGVEADGDKMWTCLCCANPSYLTKFGRLMRLILEGSRDKAIPVETEVQLLNLYLELEALRFTPPFTYHIEVDKSIEADFDQLPPMLLQPYLENAIWHGLATKEGEGHIKVHMVRKGEQLLCTIEDNGIGREAAQALKSANKSKHRSMGMSITSERLQSLEHETGRKATAEVADLLHEDGRAAGTRITITIPLL